MLKRLLLMLTVLLVSASVMTACSNGGADTTTDANGTEGETNGEMTDGAATLSATTLDTFAFEPAAWSASAGQEVSLTLDNTGQALEHTWVLLTQDETTETALTVADQGDEARKLFEARVQPGETMTESFTAPDAPGEYVVVCAVPGHAAGGMIGALTVTE